MTTYILIMLIATSRFTPAVVAEFDSLEACELARIVIIERVLKEFEEEEYYAVYKTLHLTSSWCFPKRLYIRKKDK